MKIPKLQPHVEQAVRVRLASARSKFQDLTRGIYPEPGPIAVDPEPAKPPETKENAARLSPDGQPTTLTATEGSDTALIAEDAIEDWR